MTERDVMTEMWACLNCSHRMPAAEIICIGSAPAGQGLVCPKCRSPNIMFANGEATDVPEYFGEIGTKH